MAKKAISLRLDEDLLEYFKQEYPDGYQSSLSLVLRQYVEERKQRQNYLAGRAQELFRQYYVQCFWHLKKDLIITPALISLVQEGLRKNGGSTGFKLAAELDLPPLDRKGKHHAS